jgi:hypothetical protein
VASFFLLHPGFSEGNSISSMGSDEGDALASLSCWGLALVETPIGGTSGALWWLVSASSYLSCCIEVSRYRLWLLG